MIADATTNLDVTANQIDVSAKQDLTLKAGRSHRSVIQSDINLKADNNLTITAPAGSQIIQSQGNITVKGSGSGNLTLANGGSEISIDSSGNVNIFADKLLTLKGKAMTVFDGSMEQDIGGKQSATMPSVPQIQALSENARLSLAADGIATMASSTIELSYTYQDGSPIMGAPYTIRFANGTELTGYLDDSGKAKIENAPPGQYTVQYGEDKRDYLPEDNRPKNPLYGQITPAQAAEMVRSGNTAPLIEANGIATQAGDWLWGTLQGDFNQNPSTSQIVVGTLISMIPIIDQVMDLRDITANVMLLTDDDEANDTDAWLAFTLTGIGLVPVVGSAVKGVGKVILKNTGGSLSAALAVLRKLGKGDPVKYLRDINWQDLGKQSATEVKNIVKGLRDSLDDMSTSWHYDLLLPDAAIEGMQATVKRLDDVTPKIDQHMQQAAQEIGQRVNKALDEYQGQSPIRGVTDKPTKAKADELEPPKGNELPGAGAAVNEKISSSNYKKYTPNMVNNRKMYKSDLDFTSEIPAHIDSSVHKSIRVKIENGWSNLDLMKNGNAPIGKDGKQINLHHILGQEPSPMVELLSSTHKKHHKALHGLIEDGKSFRNNQSLQYQYDKFKKEYWKLRAKDFE